MPGCLEAVANIAATEFIPADFVRWIKIGDNENFHESR